MSLEDKIRQKIEDDLAKKKGENEKQAMEVAERKKRFEEGFEKSSHIVQHIIAPTMNMYKTLLEEKKIQSVVGYSLGDRMDAPISEPFAQLRMVSNLKRSSHEEPTAVTFSARCTDQTFIVVYGVMLGDNHYVKNTSSLPFDTVTEESVVSAIDTLVEANIRDS